ncbi:peroxiredoxin [Moorella sp. E308F]|jgi:putative redox protein|uniref:OsmC family protein n=1 Tax=unclassified Neomoorella TaxID=2676739 RepID=UPI0010FFB5A2|nr:MULTISPECIES: OsmC family protein [unclassified Moorella (in: firmicutes)]MDK2894236.1 putative redox protein [Moorella sp. (in: firmicutes)]GEA14203.1 peroxiredoxin [Moorella sp. E308F]GEA18413.1 peroxiredoxin [Moorella sp. E306M]
MGKVTVSWVGKMQFVGDDGAGHRVAMDASPVYGGENQGTRPMDLMLMALGGCTGIEVTHILRKMRVSFDNLTIAVEGERAADHPKIFTRMRVVYDFQGANIPPEKVAQAIKLADEVYCSAANMMKAAGSIEYAFKINGEEYPYPFLKEASGN